MFGPEQTIATLLTTESLLFAALGVTISRTGSVPRGQRRLPGFGIACGVSLVLTLVAFGGAQAWWELFGHGQMNGFSAVAQAVGIAAGIVGQPILAWTL